MWNICSRSFCSSVHQNNLEKDIKQRDKVPVGLKHITVEDNKTKQKNPDGTEPRLLPHAPEMNFAKCCLLPRKQRCTDDCHFHLHSQVFFSILSTCLKCNHLTYNLPRFLRSYFRKFRPRNGQLKVLPGICFSCHWNIGHFPPKKDVKGFFMLLI